MIERLDISACQAAWKLLGMKIRGDDFTRVRTIASAYQSVVNEDIDRRLKKNSKGRGK